MQDFIVVIPARYHSSRFPGKPIAMIGGTPLIVRTARQVEKAVSRDHILVATDEKRIAEVVRSNGFQAVITTREAATGTDRVYLAVQDISTDIIINVQGDEPLISPEDIHKAILMKEEFPEHVINGMSGLLSDENPENPHIPKVVVNSRNELVYASRRPIPSETSVYKKQVCIYAFNRKQLQAFYKSGRNSDLEKNEDIEILRFLALGIPVMMMETQGHSMAVDTPEDVIRMEQRIDIISKGCHK